ncbi:MAG: c-type cytochrome [Aquincola tertiaricarbonis]|uniref:c-type cytochrome n=1 Tax=Aquincola TaxID=391952 RepID=UPI0012ECF1E6|nr:MULTISPECIES: c-type cytochrome [Aquincola]MCR5868707.1 c-type cytochrome [Aquincola sp. J276]
MNALSRHRTRWARWTLLSAIALPLVVMASLLVYSALERYVFGPLPAEAPLEVSVTANMWWWEVRYRHPRTGAEVVSANELRIPVGRKVRLSLRSSDVVHSFRVPPLSGRTDIMPGQVQHLDITAWRPAVYRGECAEFTANGISRMSLQVVAVAPEGFARWLEREAEPAHADEGVVPALGRQAFIDHGCTACHTVRGVSEATGGGPDLTHVGRRLTLAAGLLDNDSAQMAHWIRHAEALKPGAGMPSYGAMPAATVQAVAVYLTGLR